MFRFNHHHQGTCYLSLQAQIIRSLMMVIEPKQVGAVLM